MRGYLVYCVYFLSFCFFVRLRISQRQKKIVAWNFTCMFDYYPDRSSPILVKFGQGVAPPAPPEAYMQMSPGKNGLTWGETLAARLVGCHGLAGLGTFGISVGSMHRRSSGDSELGTRLSGHSELGTAALLKAVWWDFHLADGLVPFLIHCLLSYFSIPSLSTRNNPTPFPGRRS